MAKTIVHWVPLILWAVLFKILDGFHILSTHYNTFLILLIVSAGGLVLIYKFVYTEPQ